MHLGCSLPVPTSPDPAPDGIDGAPIFLQVLSAFIGDCVDFLAVPLRGGYVAHVLEQLERGVNGAGAGRVEPAGPLLELPYDLVAVGGLVFEHIEDDVLEVSPLEHPPPSRPMTEPRPGPAPKAPFHRFWSKLFLDLFPKKLPVLTYPHPQTDACFNPR